MTKREELILDVFNLCQKTQLNFGEIWRFLCLVKSHRNICIRQCNEADESGKLQRRREKLEIEIREMFADYPLISLELGGDPRGSTVKMLINGKEICF